MSPIRSRTAVFLLLLGVFSMPAQFVLLRYSSHTHPLPSPHEHQHRAPTATPVPRTALTPEGAEHSGAAPCHEESTPKDQAPINHDCCAVGHLHAIASPPVITAPAFTITPVNNSLLQSASIDQTALQSSEASDTGPPGSAVPIRI